MQITSFSSSIPSYETLLYLQSPTYSDIVALGTFALFSTAYFVRGYTWDKKDSHSRILYERPQHKDGALISHSNASRNVEEVLNRSNRRIVIFWGSQSGTAETFAYQLARDCKQRFGEDTIVADLSDFDADSIAHLKEEKVAIFILSTFGEGDPSDNATGLWDWINKGPGPLNSMRYYAFGLGNSNYKYYNRVVDVVVETFDRVGAKSLLPAAKADDAQGNTKEDFISWKNDVLQSIQQHYSLSEREVKYETTFKIVEDHSLKAIDLHLGEPSHSHHDPKSASLCSPIAEIPITSARDLLESDSDRQCLHLELDLTTQPTINYKSGDHLAIHPTNPLSEIKLLVAALSLDSSLTTPIHLRPALAEATVRLPSPTTALAVLTSYLSLTAPLSRDSLHLLIPFAPTQDAADTLHRLSSSREAFAAHTAKYHTTLPRLLHHLSPLKPWRQLPFSLVLELLPPLQPRYYSISSSSVISPRKAAITVSVSKTALPDNATQSIYGLASNFLLWNASNTTNSAAATPAMSTTDTTLPIHDLSSLTQATTPPPTTPNASKQPRNVVYAHIRRSRFKLPTSPTTPLILIAAGTGIAPFRAFIAERAKLASIGRPVGQILLFFGCRVPGEDELYRDELGELGMQLGGKLEIVKAYSRVDDFGGEKRCYVQDKVSERGADMLRRVEDDGAWVYVCGKAAMAREVGVQLGKKVAVEKGWGDEQVKQWREGLKRTGRWKEDVWG